MDEPTVTPNFNLTHERIDDLPLLFGMIEALKLPELLDRHLKTHKDQEGLNNGWLASVWLMYILSQGDHRKCSVQGWVERHKHALECLIEQPIRDTVEFNDDRLERMLHRLSEKKKWEAIEKDLWQSTLMVYDVGIDSIRLDSTTSCGYHTTTPEGLMQLGHSKDHRPDLPQLKLMAACAQPCGLPLGADVCSGERADDILYLPLIVRVRSMLGRCGLLYSGDCKMAALETRADIVAHQDYYLVPLPLTGRTAKNMEEWISAVVEGEQKVELFFDESRCPEQQLLGAGYEFERAMEHEIITHEEITNGLGQTMTVVKDVQVVKWVERVQVIRSRPLAKQQHQNLQERLSKAQSALRALTPEPGRGRRQFQDEALLQAAILQVLEHYNVLGLLDVNYRKEEDVLTKYVGRGRSGSNRPVKTEVKVRYQITGVDPNEAAIEKFSSRLGWRVQATNQAVSQMSLCQTVLHYRLGSCLENDFHMLKDQPLGISPLYVRLDEQIIGLTHLLLLALRILILIQMQVRQCLLQTNESISGLYEGQPSRTTTTPTAVRLLKAVAREEITLTRIDFAGTMHWHLTPLPGLLHQLLTFLKLSPTLYTRLTNIPLLVPSAHDHQPCLAYLKHAQNSS